MSKLLARAKVKRKIAEHCYREMGAEDAFRDDCCFNLQQSIEMSLKYLVEMNGGRYVENHDVRSNLNILNHIGVTVAMQSELRSIASTLIGWERESRHKEDFVSLIEDALIAQCEEAVSVTEAESMTKLPEEKARG